MRGSSSMPPGGAPRRWSRRQWLATAADCSGLAALALAAAGLSLPGVAANAANAPAAPAGPAAARRRLLIVGDSLSAEYGLARGTGWVALLEQRLAAERLAWDVVNASISGDTTSGGRSRLPALLATHRPQVLVIELGGNDALRGLPVDMTRANLDEMTRAGQAAGARVLILGMQLPPNYGRAFGEAFAAVFEQVAQARGAAVLPFFLKGVADGPEPLALFQADRIHPNAQAQPILLANVWPVLRPLLR